MTHLYCLIVLCREVTVIRLVSGGTIEEDMLQHAQMKLRLEKDITNTGINCVASLCSSPNMLLICPDGSSAVDMASLLKQGLGLTGSDST